MFKRLNQDDRWSMATATMRTYPLPILSCLLLLFGSFLTAVLSAPKAPKTYQSLKKREAAAGPAAADASQNSAGSSADRSLGRGVRQREAAVGSSTPVSSSSTDRPFTDALKQSWASGKTSAREVQHLAETAMRQGAVGLDRVASAGNFGANPSNCHRALVNAFGYPQGAPAFDFINIPGKNGLITQPFLMPHKFFASLYHERREIFMRHLCGPLDGIKEYWDNVKHTEFFRGHPLIADLHHTLPIGLHGDAGAFTKHDSLMVISWNGILANDVHGKVKRLVFTFVRKRDYTPQTLDRIWEIFAWSVNQMARGEYALKDWDGRGMPPRMDRRLAGPFTGVLTHVRGDWQFYVEVFKFPQWNGALRMCWRCRASSTIKALAFTDCREQAGWHDTRFADRSYRAHMEALSLPLPVLLALVVGLTLSCITIDCLHALDLGVSSHIIANTFWTTILRQVWGKTNQDDSTAELEKDLKSWSKTEKIGSRIQGTLTKERIRATTDTGYPKLKAKGAQTRHLAPYSLALAKRWQRVAHAHSTPEERDHATHDALVVGVNQLLVDLYQTMMTSGRFFSGEALQRIRTIGFQLPIMYMRLYSSAHKLGVKMWKLTPKLHMIQELLIYQCVEWGNPLYCWCYADEDLVGLMVEIAHSCHISTIAVTALFKWLVLAFDTEEDP